MTNRKRGYLLILVAAVLYSTTEVVLKGLGDTFAPMQVTVERVLIGAVALLPFALKDLKKRNIRLTRSDYGYFALMGEFVKKTMMGYREVLRRAHCFSNQIQ